ncbi:MAG: RNA polymerase sigma factor [Planctomycetes bacterium]|nr:RNA polymerase sigma factor [Planctomycetota bacterium]
MLIGRTNTEGLPAAGPKGTVDRPDTDGDVALVQRAIARDEAAISGLIDRLRCVPRFLHLLNSRSGGVLGEHDLADLTQEAISLIWTRLPQYTDVARIETWAYGYTRFLFLNALRKQGRTRARHVDAEIDLEQDVGIAPDHAGSDAAELLGLLDELPAEEARAIRSKVLESMTFEEIEARDAVSANTIKARYYRGLKRLHARLRSTSWGGEA